MTSLEQAVAAGVRFSRVNFEEITQQKAEARLLLNELAAQGKPFPDPGFVPSSLIQQMTVEIQPLNHLGDMGELRL